MDIEMKDNKECTDVTKEANIKEDTDTNKANEEENEEENQEETLHRKRIEQLKKKFCKKTCNKRVIGELKQMLLLNNPHFKAGLKGFDTLNEWIAVIEGPQDTPYEGGQFCLDITFPDQYPFKPPKILFKTRIYHCNVDNKGNICLDILKDKWSPALNVEKILMCIGVLMQDPNPRDPLVPDIANLFENNRELHDKHAKETTLKYAVTDIKQWQKLMDEKKNPNKETQETEKISNDNNSVDNENDSDNANASSNNSEDEDVKMNM